MSSTLLTPVWLSDMSSQQLWALLWGSYVLDGEQYTAKKMSVETILSVVTVSTLTVHLCKLLWVIGCICVRVSGMEPTLVNHAFDQLVVFLSSSVKITLHVMLYCKTPQLFEHEFVSVSDSPVSGTVTIWYWVGSSLQLHELAILWTVS